MIPHPHLSGAEREALLAMAREAIAVHLETGRIPGAGAVRSARRGGVFVTLRRRGQLRGCIGQVDSDEPIERSVVRYAIAAATEDPRFPPVAAAELNEIRIEISLLSPLQPVGSADEIDVGRDGLLVAMEGRRGLLLPQVATEMGWNREEFLAGVCRKAGLRADAWRRGATLQRFNAEVFGEPDPEAG